MYLNTGGVYWSTGCDYFKHLHFFLKPKCSCFHVLKCEWSKQLLLWQDVMLWVNSRWQQTLMFLFLQHLSFTQFICSEVEEIKRILYFSKSSKTTIKYSFTSKSPAFNNILKLWEIKCSESWNSWVFLSDMWRKSRRCVHQSSHNTV